MRDGRYWRKGSQAERTGRAKALNEMWLESSRRTGAKVGDNGTQGERGRRGRKTAGAGDVGVADCVDLFKAIVKDLGLSSQHGRNKYCD